MSVLATSRPVRVLDNDRFVCTRCGIEKFFRLDRGRPEMCRDCREVEALEARSAYVQGDRSEWAIEGQRWYDRRRRQRTDAQRKLRAAARVAS